MTSSATASSCPRAPIRNYKPEIMEKAFAIAGYPKEELEKRFGGTPRALQYGAPPHGGIAPGIDRMVMLLCVRRTGAEVVMFPMNQQAEDLADGTVRGPRRTAQGAEHPHLAAEGEELALRVLLHERSLQCGLDALLNASSLHKGDVAQADPRTILIYSLRTVWGSALALPGVA